MSKIDGMFHHLSFPSDKAIIFHCKMGGRSARVCEYVTQTIKPDQKIYNLDGGILAWDEVGLITV
jgi:rhodanese-related sulfurtransferase